MLIVSMIVTFCWFVGCAGPDSSSAPQQGTASDRVTVIVDVNGLETYDLRNTINEKDKAFIATYDQSALRWTLSAKYVMRDAVAAAQGIVKVSDIEKRLYTLIVKDGNGQGIYKADVDFYDSDDELVWNTVADVGDVMLYRYTTPVTGVSIEESPHGRKGKYFKVTRPATVNVEFTLVPLHCKEFYARLGNDYTLTFDWYLVLGGHTQPIGEIIPATAGFTTGAGTNAPIESLSWQTWKIALSTLLLYYDDISLRPEGISFRNRTMAAINDNGNDLSIEWWLGNFKLVNDVL